MNHKILWAFGDSFTATTNLMKDDSTLEESMAGRNREIDFDDPQDYKEYVARELGCKVVVDSKVEVVAGSVVEVVAGSVVEVVSPQHKISIINIINFFTMLFYKIIQNVGVLWV